VKIEVTNDSGYANLIHWHGLMIPSLQDGATEEGSPIIDPGKSLTYSFVSKPSGTRWHHSHAMAMTDLSKSTYSGEFGFLIVEPAAGDPGSYDRGRLPLGWTLGQPAGHQERPAAEQWAGSDVPRRYARRSHVWPWRADPRAAR
jgi:FtsP/CotA-like multicopper oxidase with cupredoxin domain